MFGSNNFLKAIQKGDLEKLKKIINKSPSILELNHLWHAFGLGFSGSLLHYAAFYNQPQIVEYLVKVKDKSVAVDKLSGDNWTPLHHAARGNAPQAVAKLLELGADPHARTSQQSTPYDLARGAETRDKLRPYLLEELEEQAKAREEAARKAKAARVEGTWTPGSSDEIVHERELPNGQYSLTRIFNFTTESLTTIARDLKSGNISPPETRTFDELQGKKKILDEARARLAEFNNASASKEDVTGQAVPPASVAQKRRGDYTDLTGAGL